MFRDRCLRRRLKGTTPVSSSTPAGSTPDDRHTASILRLVEGLSLPTRNATRNSGFSIFTRVSSVETVAGAIGLDPEAAVIQAGASILAPASGPVRSEEHT